MRRFWIAVALIAGVVVAPAAPAQAPIEVIASFSILADFTRNVAGDRARVAALVGPGGDAHVYTPSPADAKKVSDAKLVIVNGLGFEGWLPRLVKSSGSTARVIEATKGIKPREADDDGDSRGHDKDKSHGHAHGDEHVDPHAWQSVANAKIYVGNIRDALIAADPAGTEAYRANADA
jgi:zinc/manganese transport system substrate-binding protein